MNLKSPSEDAAADRLERRWFAAFRAASAARAECEALLDRMATLESEWSCARTRLAELEAIRDSLGEELMQMEAGSQPATVPAVRTETFAA